MFTSASSEKMASDYRSGRVFEPCTLCGRCNHRACSQHGRTMTAADQYGESGKFPKLRGKSRYDASLRLSVAPMMDWTDTHCRVFHRLLAPHARLYTEMVHANAVIHGDRDRLLAMDPVEHPVALQLGGSEPGMLAQAARIGAGLGFDEINLNCGCPSDRVQAGRFGACLLRAQALVAGSVAAMLEAVSPLETPGPNNDRQSTRPNY